MVPSKGKSQVNKTEERLEKRNKKCIGSLNRFLCLL